MRNLDYANKLEYLRKNIPDEKVIELQNEIGKTFIGPKTFEALGFLGKHKIEGIVDVNLDLGTVSFTDKMTNQHRTIVKMTPDEIRELVQNSFHLFPNV